MNPVGMVIGWRDNRVLIQFKRDSIPGIGDFIYAKQDNRLTLLQLTSLSSWIEALTPGIEAYHRSAVFEDAFTLTGIAEAFLEFNEAANALYTPSTLPKPGTPVYKVEPGDVESNKIMEKISSMTGDGVPVFVLRSGIASHPSLRGRLYFIDFKIRVNLSKTIPKHILVSGQTGAGKTTGVKGFITASFAYSNNPVSWLILDRHGEYGDFINVVNDVSKNIPVIRHITLYYHSSKTSYGAITPIALSDIGVPDISMALDLEDEEVLDLEDLLDNLTQITYTACVNNLLAPSICNMLISVGNEDVKPRGDLLALYLLIFDNAIRLEASKATKNEKYGFHKYFLERGFQNVTVLRKLRRIISNALGITTRRREFVVSEKEKKLVYVIDDSNSVFKTISVFKQPDLVAGIIYSLLKVVEKRDSKSFSEQTFYDFLPSGKAVNTVAEKVKSGILVEAPGLGLDEIVRDVNTGNMVILDLSRVSTREGDLVALSLARRILEDRMARGPFEASGMPPVAIVSEEAPLYLSSEKVKSVYNSFARVAREGRKFNIGIIAITQMATMIDRQLLANFNTVIAMRTNYTADIEFFRNVGIPGEALPFLNEREAYVYSADSQLRRPLPVYIPAHSEKDLIVKSREHREGLEVSGEALKSLVEHGEEV
ncbi:ATP-binding protein [Thermogladius sp. 4427co]|uniref:ATP-binding protein n=1 Tax=Thermogladius sp. 4427co TaxID=3450718 RepID=UPI003F78F7A1